MNNFNGLEILKIAILMEEEGQKFYTNGAKYTTGKIKDFLLAAAGQEFIHKEQFTKIYNDLLEKKEDDYDYLFDTDVTAYLKALIENKVFDKKEPAEDAFKSLKSALEYAIKSEKLTVEVYTKMYEGISIGEVKEVLSGLIEQEKAHVDYFTKLLSEIEE
ncbi:ferritin family protein [Clostridium sp. CX1]|uniref:Ferritin family protein n=1 Tax=Clostridium tanneri TaxID=3037988 RepID=A0ABU4JR32_9CLOT|nr:MULTISPECIES: ferritin family protein [unclassified Clostridium]MCT8977629.1 ferritin family protein [Clostridium sp. CX1]MDW8800408.1 ferritin family protein [Clostridium sp. A1-XYC3]